MGQGRNSTYREGLRVFVLEGRAFFGEYKLPAPEIVVARHERGCRCRDTEGRPANHATQRRTSRQGTILRVRKRKILRLRYTELNSRRELFCCFIIIIIIIISECTVGDLTFPYLTLPYLRRRTGPDSFRLLSNKAIFIPILAQCTQCRGLAVKSCRFLAFGFTVLH